MSSEEVSNAGKRAIKRSFSPDNIITKLSKLNDFNAMPSPPNTTVLKVALNPQATTAATAATLHASQQMSHLDCATIAHSNSQKVEYSIANTSSPKNSIITMSYNTKLNPPISIQNFVDKDTIILPAANFTSSSTLMEEQSFIQGTFLYFSSNNVNQKLNYGIMSYF